MAGSVYFSFGEILTDFNGKLDALQGMLISDRETIKVQEQEQEQTARASKLSLRVQLVMRAIKGERTSNRN